MREIKITIDDGWIEVWESGRTTGQLAWDEMLGQIVELTHPGISGARYPMLTPQEWVNRDARIESALEPIGAETEKTTQENTNARGDSTI